MNLDRAIEDMEELLESFEKGIYICEVDDFEENSHTEDVSYYEFTNKREVALVEKMAELIRNELHYLKTGETIE